MSKRSAGAIAEGMVVGYLEQQGWRIVGRNLHYRFGEIDILADLGQELVVVEVKAKRNQAQGAAVEMVTVAKQHTLRKLAHWVQVEYNKPVRIDVVTIDGYGTPQPRITHYPFAVGE